MNFASSRITTSFLLADSIIAKMDDINLIFSGVSS